MRDLPFVPWFTADWLASSARIDMSLCERAIYLDLLFHAWDRAGAIPADQAKLAKLAMATPAEFAGAWPEVQKHFVPHPDESGMLTNTKMLAVIRKQADIHAKKSQAGRAGGIASGVTRKQNRSRAEAKTNHLEIESEPELETETQKQTWASQSDARVTDSPAAPKRKRSPSVKSISPEALAQFEVFWDAYWLRKAKAAALKAFLKHADKADLIMAGVATQRDEMLAREPKHRPHAATWLNGERWADEVAASGPAFPKIENW
jgi:uncharacterized protein YdaU (DUF1376 family)